MDTWSNTCRKCDWCGVKYAPRQNISYRRKDFCSFKCKEDYIDAMSQVQGAFVPEGTGEDNPGRDLFDWALANI